MRIVICDDEETFTNNIEEVVQKVAEDKQIQWDIIKFNNSNSLLNYCEKNSIDGLFLDIDMPGFDGFDVLKILNETKKKVPVVFVSSMDVMFEAQEFQPFRFVPKNRMKELPRIVEALLVKLIEIQEKRDSCKLKIGTSEININFSEVKFFESCSNHKIAICFISGERVNYRGTISEIDTQLKEFGFLRIQVGFLINYLFIEKLNSREVILKDGTTVKLSRDKITQIREQYLKLMRADRW